MALVSALPSSSAQIIPLPSAAAAPIANPSFRGHWPAIVYPAWRMKRRRKMRMQSGKALPAAPMAWPLPPSNPTTWPFGFVRRDQFELLSAQDRAEIEGYIMGRVVHRAGEDHV